MEAIISEIQDDLDHLHSFMMSEVDDLPLMKRRVQEEENSARNQQIYCQRIILALDEMVKVGSHAPLEGYEPYFPIIPYPCQSRLDILRQLGGKDVFVPSSWRRRELERLLQVVEEGIQVIQYKQLIDNANGARVNIEIILQQIDWGLIASKYFKGKSGLDCKARWKQAYLRDRTWNHEDKSKLVRYMEKESLDWVEILRKVNRESKLACFKVYIGCRAKVKQRWGEMEDKELLRNVEKYGNKWQYIAYDMEGKSGMQCQQRYISIGKTLGSYQPWEKAEDCQLVLLVLCYGQEWTLIAQHMNRSSRQIRERWLSVLSPPLAKKWGPSTSFPLSQ